MNENGSSSVLERAMIEASGQAAKYRHELQRAKQQLKALQEERDQLSKERDQLKTTPNEWRAKAEDLENKLRSRDHRDAWMKIAGETLNNKVELSDVWSKIQYQVGESVPSDSEIRKLIDSAREIAPYLFRQAPEPGTPAPVGAPPTPVGVTPESKQASQVPFDASRGERDTGQRKFVVRQSEMRDVNFMMANSKMISEASRKGILEIRPD